MNNSKSFQIQRIGPNSVRVSPSRDISKSKTFDIQRTSPNSVRISPTWSGKSPSCGGYRTPPQPEKVVLIRNPGQSRSSPRRSPSRYNTNVYSVATKDMDTEWNF